MTQVATVKSIKQNGMAQVQIRRLTACGHDCSKCNGCTQVITGETVVMAQNQKSAAVGDLVLVESQSSAVLGAAAMVYLLPFALLFLGYFLAAAVTGLMEGTVPALSGLAGFALGLLGAVAWDRREKKRRNVQFRIVDIRQRCSAT